MDFSPYRKYSNTLIETGTHIGESVQAALSAGFEKVISVELYEKFYRKSSERFKNNPSVKLHFGRSTDLLPEMISGCPIPSVFWLDAHPSGPGTALHDELMSGDKEAEQDNILLKELTIILNHGRHVVLIDDQQGWATAKKFADQIDEYYPDCYTFSIEDEHRPGVHYKEKVLVCLPILAE